MIFLGIGSNLSSSFGSRFKNIEKAISYFKANQVEIIRQSSFYESYSYPNKNDPKFINIIISIKTSLTPEELMDLALSIEEKLERKRQKKNDPRTCDIDIIDFNGKILNFKFNKMDLVIPHKNLSTRNFVLYPLKEIYPDWIHPKSKKNIDQLIKNLNKSNNEITKLTQSDINTYVK